MSKIDELIKEKCPNGVKYRPLWELTTWDKKFNAVDNAKQPKVLKYYYYLANDLKPLVKEGGDIKILTTNESELFTTEDDVKPDTIADQEVVAIPWGGNPIIQYYKGKFVTADNRIAISNDISILDTKYLYYVLMNKLDEISSFYRGSGIKHPSMAKVLDLPIPLPPLEIQQEIVGMLNSFTELEAELEAELTKRKQQYEYYRDHLLSFENIAGEGGQVEWLTLGDIGEVCMCRRILKNQTQDSGIPFFKIGTFGKKEDSYIASELFEEYKRKYSYPKKGDILISAAGTIGRTVVFNGEPAYFQDSNIVWIDNDEEKVTNRYLYYFYQTKPWRVSSGGTIARIYNNDVRSVKIPVPTKKIQERIVYVLDNFDAVCNDLNIGLPAEIEARQKQYEYYRDRLLSFDAVIGAGTERERERERSS